MRVDFFSENVVNGTENLFSADWESIRFIESLARSSIYIFMSENDFPFFFLWYFLSITILFFILKF